MVAVKYQLSVCSGCINLYSFFMYDFSALKYVNV